MDGSPKDHLHPSLPVDVYVFTRIYVYIVRMLITLFVTLCCIDPDAGDPAETVGQPVLYISIVYIKFCSAILGLPHLHTELSSSCVCETPQSSKN